MAHVYESRIKKALNLFSGQRHNISRINMISSNPQYRGLSYIIKNVIHFGQQGPNPNRGLWAAVLIKQYFWCTSIYPPCPCLLCSWCVHAGYCLDGCVICTTKVTPFPSECKRGSTWFLCSYFEKFFLKRDHLTWFMFARPLFTEMGTTVCCITVQLIIVQNLLPCAIRLLMRLHNSHYVVV